MGKIRTSVVIPVHDRVEYFEQAFASACAATGDSDEILVVDDGSKPESHRKIKQIVSDRGSLMRITHGGPAAALNAGVAAAQGEYVATFSSDDVMHADHLDRSIDTLETEQVAFSFCTPLVMQGDSYVDPNQSVFRAAGMLHDVPKQKLAAHLFFVGNFLCAPSMVTQRTTLAQLGPFNRSLLLLQDHEYWLRAQFHNLTLYISDFPTLTYRTAAEGNNLSSQYAERSAIEKSALISKALDNVSKSDLLDCFADVLGSGCEQFPLEISVIYLLLSHEDKFVRQSGFDRALKILESEAGRATLEETLGLDDKLLAEVMQMSTHW